MLKNTQTNFEKLKGGILFAFQNKQIREPSYEAVNYLTEKSSALSKMNQYSTDIEKIIREMNFSQLLIENLPENNYLKELSISPEDYLLYHQGYYLELVHQMKDKLFNLLDAFSKINEKIYEEKENNVKIKDIAKRKKIRKHGELIKLIRDWNQEGDNPISISLKKRTRNHHSRSNLHLNSDYQDIKISRLFSSTKELQSLLSEYGVKQMRIKEKKGFEEWHKKTKKIINNTNIFINKNIEAISGHIVRIFNLPTLSSEKAKRIALQSYNGPTIEKIHNKTSLEKLQKTDIFYSIVKVVETGLKQFFNEQIISYYVIGSSARGESKPGISDLNLVVVTKNKIPNLSQTIRQSFIKPHLKALSKIVTDVDVKILTEKEFLSLKHFIVAFSCRHDGLLLFGEDITKQKRFPVPGLGLSYMLNRNFKNQINEIKSIINSSIEIPEDELMRLVRRTVKSTLRMMFGEVMANHNLYAVEMYKIKEMLIWAHQKNWQIIARLYYFLREQNIFTNKKSLEIIIDELCIYKLYPLLDDLETKSKNWFTDWQKKY